MTASRIRPCSVSELDFTSLHLIEACIACLCAPALLTLLTLPTLGQVPEGQGPGRGSVWPQVLPVLRLSSSKPEKVHVLHVVQQTADGSKPEAVHVQQTGDGSNPEAVHEAAHVQQTADALDELHT